MHFANALVPITSERGACLCDMQVSVYPVEHERAQGWQLERKPDGRKAKRLEKWKGVVRAK